MPFRLAVCVCVLMGMCAPMRAQDRKSQNSLTVSFPNKTWWVEVDSPGFAVKGKGRKPDGRYYLFAHDARSNVILSVMLEQAPEGADSSSCAAYLQSRMQSVAKLGVVPADEKTSEFNSMAVVEYMIPTVDGKAVQQKNVMACTMKEDVYVDVHLSKAQFQASDEEMLLDILNHVEVTSASAPVRTSAAVSTEVPAH